MDTETPKTKSPFQKYWPTVLIGVVSGGVGAIVISLAVAGLSLQNYATFTKRFLGEEFGATSTSTTAAPSYTALLTSGAQSQEAAVVSVVHNASPAVVSIIISEKVSDEEQAQSQDDSSSDPFESDPFFQQFFGNNDPFSQQSPDEQQPAQNGNSVEEVGGGSGFLVSSDGLIVTNKHVVEDTKATYTVYTNDGKKHTAKVLALDPVYDIALVKIDGTGYPYLSFGNSDQLEVGQTAIAIGNALAEFRNTVSVGVVSGLSRSITAGDEFGGSSEQLEDVIQTDAAINPGNSGGPLLDLTGRVIGMNVAVVSDSQNIGFSLPANEVASVVTSVEKTGKIVRAFLGVRYVQITPDLVDAKNLSVDYGVLVEGDGKSAPAVMPGSPAAKAGLMSGDIILDVDSVKLDDDHSLADAIRAKAPGDVVSLTILRKGVQEVLKVTLTELPSSVQ